jgi:hypothetical protein
MKDAEEFENNHLVKDITGRALIVTIMDQLSDFQDNRLIAPVRVASIRLYLKNLDCVPEGILFSVSKFILSHENLFWISKYNVFMLLKEHL